MKSAALVAILMNLLIYFLAEKLFVSMLEGVVRVLRLWKVPAFLNPTETSSIEMVLVDKKVTVIFTIFLLLIRVFVYIYRKECVVVSLLDKLLLKICVLKIVSRIERGKK
jgi:hypothetical protein